MIRSRPRGVRSARGALRLAPLLALAAALLSTRTTAAPPSGDKRFTFVDTLLSPAPAPGRARLWLLREQFARKSPLPPERVYLDGAPVAFLPQQSYVAFDVDPGPHVLTGVVGALPVVMELPPGAVRLLRLRELIDEHDVTQSRWIADNPDLAREMVASAGLPFVRATPRGQEELERKASNAWSRPPARPATPDSGAGGFTDILFEHPLDPLNLKREFSVYTGKLELGAERLDYYMEKRRRDVRVVIPYASIVDLRYGGTRFTGTAPWIDVFYRSTAGTMRASFAPASPDEPESVYNRLFFDLEERWHAARPALTDSVPEAPHPTAPLDPASR